MSSEFQLQPKPKFKATVSIPRPGEDDGKLTFTFRHKPIKELSQLETLEGKTAVDFLASIIEAWALPEEYSRTNLETLLDNYPSATNAIISTYYRELTGNREKN